MDSETTKFDEIKKRFKNNRYGIILIVLFLTISSLSIFTKSISNIFDFVSGRSHSEKMGPSGTKTTHQPFSKTEGQVDLDETNEIIASINLQLEELSASYSEVDSDIKQYAEYEKTMMVGMESLTPEYIANTFRVAPSVKQTSMQDTFVGQNIEWALYLGAANNISNYIGVGAIPFHPNYNEPLIVFIVEAENNEKLKLAKQGDTLFVTGEIVEANQFKIILKEVKIQDIQSRKSRFR